MDFSSRSTQQTQSAHPGSPLGTSSTLTSSKQSGKGPRGRLDSKWWRVGAVVLLFCITVLIAAVVALLAVGGSPNQSKYIKSDKYQAVFLTNGQVYFGHIKNINSDFINLSNIYYLQSSGSNSSTASPTTANNNVTLIKLGCELHQPYDQMLINTSQVSFWENIQSDGQVGKGIAQLPKCTKSTNTTNQSNTSAQTPTPTTPDTTKKP